MKPVKTKVTMVRVTLVDRTLLVTNRHTLVEPGDDAKERAVEKVLTADHKTAADFTAVLAEEIVFSVVAGR